jgi:hypothetical protein
MDVCSRAHEPVGFMLMGRKEDTKRKKSFHHGDGGARRRINGGGMAWVAG